MQGLAIDAGGIAIFGFLLKRDLDARDKQIARMTREEDLGSLQIELANKKTLRLAQLRQFARIVRYPTLPAPIPIAARLCIIGKTLQQSMLPTLKACTEPSCNGSACTRTVYAAVVLCVARKPCR